MNSENTEIVWNAGRRDGIALIIVLGLLSVLVIIGVAFSISMRTERLATRAYIDVVKTRQLVHTALNRVLDDHLVFGLDGRPYPEWDAFTERINSQREIYLLGNRTLTSATVFVSGAVREAAFAEDGVNWLPLRDAIDTNRFYGEYAFLVVNNSGLLDANQIGGWEITAGPLDPSVPRQMGTNSAEIRFHSDILGEVDTSPGQRDARLLNYRREFRRFESVPELYFLGSTTFDNPATASAPFKQHRGATPPFVDNFHVFSRFPFGYGEQLNLRANTDIAYVGGDPASDWNLGGIRSALADLESPSIIPNLDHFIYCLYDYADPGFVPYPPGNPVDQFQRISAKPVPMINEVIVSNAVRLVSGPGGTTRLFHRVYLTVETWFPFPPAIAAGASFQVRLNGPPPAIVNVIPPAYSSLRGPMAPPPSLVSPPFNPAIRPFNSVTFAFESEQDVSGPSFGSPVYPVSGLPIAAIVSIPANIEVVENGRVDPVDVVFGPWANFNLARPIPPPLVIGGPEERINTQARSTDDPRINWNPSDPLQWTTVAPTFDAINSTVNKGNNANQDEINLTYPMFAARTPLTSVGEVGYLLYDQNRPWQTVRLIGATTVGSAQVIDRLTIFPRSAYPRRGLVNVNTRQVNALAATIWGVPIRFDTTFDPDNALGNVDRTLDVAQHMVDQIDGNQPILNLSDLSTRLNATTIDQILGTSDKFTRESLIRNTMGLWGTRHQLFTICLAARTFSEGYDPGRDFDRREDMVSSEQRAVAVVWRDPFLTTDSYGFETHQSWVQFFHWFSGAFEE